MYFKFFFQLSECELNSCFKIELRRNASEVLHSNLINIQDCHNNYCTTSLTVSTTSSMFLLHASTDLCSENYTAVIGSRNEYNINVVMSCDHY